MDTIGAERHISEIQADLVDMAVRTRLQILTKGLGGLVETPLAKRGIDRLVRSWIDLLETPVNREIRRVIASTLTCIVKDDACPEDVVRMVLDHSRRYESILLEKDKFPMSEYSEMFLSSERTIERIEGRKNTPSGRHQGGGVPHTPPATKN